MKHRFVEAIGWYGVAAILAAYALNAFGALGVEGVAYHVLNLTGAAAIVLVSLRRRAYQPAALNVVWAVIAAAAIVRLIFR